jgi:addiction module HigA family antidote
VFASTTSTGFAFVGKVAMPSMSRLLITTELERKMNRKMTGRIPFPHPGDTIREDFLKPLRMSVNRLALELRVPATRMTEIVHGRRGITADTALRLGRYFNTTPKFWLNLQASYDLAVTSEARSEEIERTVRPRETA